ncbi:MAG: oligosaccharide flippase family protein [Lachnospiraceae bacterium]|nr:oligosaccharide flippase family protein [Lachnospiraceae bacterium]
MISLIVILISRVILVRLIGSKGVCFFSLSNELFFLIAGAASYAIEEAASSMIENRMNRQQITNAKNVALYSIVYALIVGVLAGVILLSLMNSLVNGFFNLHLSYLSYYFIIPAIPMFILTGAIKGYFKGVNQTAVIMRSQIVFVVVYSVTGLIFGFVSMNYGRRVSELLRNEEFSYSYGAMGASIGLLLASSACLLHMLVVYFLYSRRTVLGVTKEYSKVVDSPMQIIFNLAATALIPFALWVVFMLLPIINIALLFKTGAKDYSLDFSYGEYYGKTTSITGIIVLLISVFSYAYIRKAIGAVKREEYRNAREKLKAMIHRCATLSLYAAAMLVILADNILDTLYASNGESTALYLQIQALCILFAVYAVMFTEMMISMQNHVFALGIAAVSMVVHLIVSIVFVSTFKLSIIGIILGNLIFFGMYAFISFVFISRAFQYTQEWFRTFVVTMISALISALIGMLLNKVLSPLVGKGISLVIVLISSTLLYIVIILALKGYQEEELEESALGRMVLAIGRAVNLI